MSAHPRKPLVVRRNSAMNSDINVTPLVDVVLVLLIIFMVLTPLLEKDIVIQVPATETVEQTEAVPLQQLLVKVASNGELTLNGRPLSNDEDYEKKLRERLDPRIDIDKVVFVTADEDASYKNVVHALDVAKRAGAVTLGMSTDDPIP